MLGCVCGSCVYVHQMCEPNKVVQNRSHAAEALVLEVARVVAGRPRDLFRGLADACLQVPAK